MSLRPGAAALVHTGRLPTFVRTGRLPGFVAWIGGAAVLGLAACSRHPSAAQRNQGPFLSIVPQERAAAVRTGVTPESVALALGGLPPEELPRLRQRLADSTDGALRLAAPEVFDLDWSADRDAGADSVRQALLDLPTLTAAANVLGSPWEAPGISVHLEPVCEPTASRCTPVFVRAAAQGDSLVRRGRTLAWALADAALLRVPASAREGLLRSLRTAQLRPSSTLAMVFGATRGTLDAPELDRLRHEARRALEQLRPEALERPWLRALDAVHADWQLPIALDADEVLVVPRLSALARLQDFAAEVESAGTFAWVACPVAASVCRRQ
jgi:hypothetical protein